MDLRSPPPRWEGPILAFVVVILTVYAVALWWSWTNLAVEGFRGGEPVAETGLAC